MRLYAIKKDVHNQDMRYGHQGTAISEANRQKRCDDRETYGGTWRDSSCTEFQGRTVLVVKVVAVSSSLQARHCKLVASPLPPVPPHHNDLPANSSCSRVANCSFELMRVSNPNDDLGAVLYTSLPSVVSHTIDSHSPIRPKPSSATANLDAAYILNR